MITSSKGIFKKVILLEPGESVYYEVVNETIATQCSRRLTASCRFRPYMSDMRFSTRMVLAIQSPTLTQLLLRIERLQ